MLANISLTIVFQREILSILSRNFSPNSLGFGGRLPPSWWLSSPTFKVVTSSFFESLTYSFQPYPHAALTKTNLLIGYFLSQLRTTVQPLFPLMRPPPEPP